MQSLDVFFPHIQPWLMASPEPLTRSALLRAAREFCEKTSIIQLTVGPLAATVGQPDFAFTLPTNLELARVKFAWWGLAPLDLLAPDEIGSPLVYTPTAGTQTRQNGTPSAALLTGPLTISVSPPPNATAANMLTMRVAVRPTLSATTVPDELYTDWLDAIVARACLLLAGVPGATMVNAEQAVLANQTYVRLVSNACDVARRGRHQKSMRVLSAPFA